MSDDSHAARIAAQLDMLADEGEDEDGDDQEECTDESA
jgi:hypothetical protein